MNNSPETKTQNCLLNTIYVLEIEDTELNKYADDSAEWVTGKTMAILEEMLKDDTDKIVMWYDKIWMATNDEKQSQSVASPVGGPWGWQLNSVQIIKASIKVMGITTIFNVQVYAKVWKAYYQSVFWLLSKIHICQVCLCSYN